MSTQEENPPEQKWYYLGTLVHPSGVAFSVSVQAPTRTEAVGKMNDYSQELSTMSPESLMPVLFFNTDFRLVPVN